MATELLFHELVWVDREARPAVWRTRCGEDAALEQCISPAPGSHYKVGCPGCLLAAMRERADRAERDRRKPPGHERLAEVSRLRSAGDVPVLLAAVETVRKRHRPSGCLTVRPCPEHAMFGEQHLDPGVRRNCPDCLYRDWDACAECGTDREWPCPTYSDLSRALAQKAGE